MPMTIFVGFDMPFAVDGLRLFTTDTSLLMRHYYTTPACHRRQYNTRRRQRRPRAISFFVFRHADGKPRISIFDRRDADAVLDCRHHRYRRHSVAADISPISHFPFHFRIASQPTAADTAASRARDFAAAVVGLIDARTAFQHQQHDRKQLQQTCRAPRKAEISIEEFKDDYALVEAPVTFRDFGRPVLISFSPEAAFRFHASLAFAFRLVYTQARRRARPIAHMTGAHYESVTPQQSVVSRQIMARPSLPHSDLLSIAMATSRTRERWARCQRREDGRLTNIEVRHSLPRALARATRRAPARRRR